MNAQAHSAISAIRHPPRMRYDDSDPFVRHLSSVQLNAVDLCDAVRAISEADVVGVHYHRAFDAAECRGAAEKIAASGECTPYEGADLDHLGMAIFETAFGTQQRRTYFERAIPNIQRARALWGTSRFPLDLVRSLLDEGSPHGANLLRIDNRPCAAGLIRVQNEGVEIMPHIDDIGRDVQDSIEAQQIEEQITVVIPLTVGTGGGEPTIYPVRLGMHQYEAHRLPDPHSYAVDDKVLPSFGVTLHPQIGDMMLWDARYLHRVGAVLGGSRMTLSFFIGICRNGRIVIFS